VIVQHYLHLLRRYHRWVIWTVLAATLGTAILSWAWLLISPVYTATASVAMLPTEAEYAFGRETGTGPRATMRGLTATYIEYLKSRPVIETTLDRISAEGGPGTEPAPEPGFLERTARGAVGFARRLYRAMDSGSYVPSTERERALGQLMKAISLHKIPDSYVLRVEVGLEDPDHAAAVANALAEAYVERVAEQMDTSASQMEGFLREQIALREAALEQLISREEALKKGLGALSLEEERQFVMRARETERQKLVDAQVEVETALAEMGMLQAENLVQSGRNLAELNEARALADAKLNAGRRSLELREGSLSELSASLDALNAKEAPLLELSRQRITMEGELTELNNRMLSTSLVRSAAMTQVRVIDPAVAPAYPSSPRVVKNTLAAGFVSMMAMLFVLVLFDTLSGTVKTVPDLARVVGSRCAGMLDRSLSRSTVRSSDRGRRRLKAQGAALEQRLAILGAFDAPVIYVTGFGAEEAVSDAALALDEALAGVGPAATGRVKAEPAMPVFDGQTQLAVDDAVGSEVPAFRIDSLGPVSARLSLTEAARRSPAVICVIPAGEVPDSLVEELLERCLAAGLTRVSFLLLES